MLDPQVVQLLAWVEKARAEGKSAPYSTLTPQAARALYDKQSPTLDFKPRALARVETITLPLPEEPRPARVYAASLGRNLPVVLFFHGGGFTIGSLDSHDGLCRYLAEQTGAIVLAIDYRLAPEHPFPAAVDDAFAAYRWLIANAAQIGGDAARIAVMGDSAGGTLTIVTCLQARDAGLPQPKLQLPIYPATQQGSTASRERLANGYLLDAATMAWFNQQYLRAASMSEDWRAAPLLRDDLNALAPAWMAVAGYDPLVDEGIAFAEKLRAAGVAVTVRHDPGMLHGYFSMAGMLGVAKAAVDDCCGAIRISLT